MDQKQIRAAIGLMSGTSMDGVDAALLYTDGENALEKGATHFLPYDPAFVTRLRAILGGKGDVKGVSRDLTDYHIKAAKQLIEQTGVTPSLIGFHGHTILHDPKNGKTWQIGNAQRLAFEVGVNVIHDFRSADVKAGGQGAPLVPVFHKALAADWEKPAAILNIGGVANITYIGADGELLAFDTGPGNAPIDDWMRRNAGKPRDDNGETARGGKIDAPILAQLLAADYFTQKPPKSLDRDHFDFSVAQDLSLADGAATLTAFTVSAVMAGLSYLPEPPKRWVIAGGGRKNKFLFESLSAALQASTPGAIVQNFDDLGWDGDFIEAWAFAYLAVRSSRGLPISFPGTTGVAKALRGGVSVGPAPGLMFPGRDRF